MLRAELESMRCSQEKLEDCWKKLHDIAEQTTECTEQLCAVCCPELQEEQQQLRTITGDLQEQEIQLAWLTKALELLQHQYQQAEKAVVYRCENSCIQSIARKMQRIDLGMIQKHMDDITFE